MFFVGIVGSYIVLRFGASEWKPQELRELATGMPVFNTGLLVLSALFMYLGVRAIHRDDPYNLRVYVGITALYGMTFVGVQVYEFVRLQGLVPLEGNVFGSIFYTAAGLHGLHVLGGVVLLGVVLAKAWRGRYHKYRCAGVELASYYWYFVVLVWVFLFLVLYVS